MLGIAPDAVEFEPYTDAQGVSQTTRVLASCESIPIVVNTMRIFDGQHRRRAIQDVIVELSNARDNRRTDKLGALLKSSMTIVLYVEDDIKTLRQMFADASKTKPIEANTVTRFDRRDAFSLAAVWLADNSRLFQERVEMERSTVLRSSQHLLAINQLATILKSLEVGYGRRVSRVLNDEYMLDCDSFYNRCRRWSDEFMPAAREEYSGLLSGEISDAEFPQVRAATFAYDVTFIRVLAGCYCLWFEASEHDSWEPLANSFMKPL